MKLREDGLSVATCNRHIASGKSAWKVFDPDIPNPFGIKYYNEGEHIGNSTRFLNPDQRDRLLSVAKMVSQDLYEILVVALGTGWRKSEILSLKRSDVDFRSGVAVVSQKRGRIIHRPLSEDVLSILVSIPDNGRDFFWINKETNRPYDKFWKSPWHHARKQAGIPDDFRFHDLRHDFAIRAFAVNGSQRAVQDLLGHHQMSTTQRYVKVMPNYLREVLNKMDK
jgi:integrase